MKVKLNRGPMHGKRMECQPGTYSERVQVTEPVQAKYDWKRGLDPWEPIKFRQGHYQKSNVKLKDGTWVFEWMGWYE